ncbi:hypothetical protein EVAR_83530_1 [Eumeta japonica]|uniref:Uncharacterized protein n=1 Tax=Eumeta variegata TaxID=151549 RepID=A0A4C1ZH28_EUMVA|nr:hypothetical protein EVAR_83530_1 [Eumeta japonica]
MEGTPLSRSEAGGAFRPRARSIIERYCKGVRGDRSEGGAGRAGTGTRPSGKVLKLAHRDNEEVRSAPRATYGAWPAFRPLPVTLCLHSMLLEVLTVQIFVLNWGELSDQSHHLCRLRTPNKGGVKLLARPWRACHCSRRANREQKRAVEMYRVFDRVMSLVRSVSLDNLRRVEQRDEEQNREPEGNEIENGSVAETECMTGNRIKSVIGFKLRNNGGNGTESGNEIRIDSNSNAGEGAGAKLEAETRPLFDGGSKGRVERGLGRTVGGESSANKMATLRRCN